MKKFKRKIELEDFEAIQYVNDNVVELSKFANSTIIYEYGILYKLYNGVNLSNPPKTSYLIIEDEIKGNLKLEEGDWIFKNKEGKILVFNDKYVNKNFEQYDNQ